MLSLTLLQFKVTLETPMIVKEAWVKSEVELIGLILTAGCLDEQCHNLVEFDSTGFT